MDAVLQPPRNSLGSPILLLSAAAFCSAAGARIADPLLPDIAEAFHGSVSRASVIAWGFALAYGICQVFWGPLGDRLGKYRLVAVVTLGGAFATGLSVFADSIGSLGATRLLSGAVSAAIIPLSLAHIGDQVPYAQRQAVLARFLSGQVFGIIAGQAAGGVLAAWLGWRGVFLTLAGIYLSVGLLLVRSLAAQPARNAAAARFNFRAAYGTLFSSAKTLPVLATVFCEGLLFFGAFTYVGAYLRARYGIGYGMVGAELTSFGLGALGYTLLAPRIIGFLGEARMVLSGGFILAAAFLLIAAHLPLWAMPAPIALCGLGYYLLHNTLQTHATQMAPAVRGVAVSVFSSCFFVGQALGVSAFGVMAQHTGDAWVFRTAALLLPLLAINFRRIAIPRQPRRPAVALEPIPAEK